VPEPKTTPKKVGRPTLPKGSAKAVMIRIRVTPVEQKTIEARAKAQKQAVSDWIRNTLNAALEA
jgi:predicted HicB family RNase H-like nuclease